jgi:hypothetical protein
MRTSASPTFDHGAAIRVPAAHDRRGWRLLLTWLGEYGRIANRPGTVDVTTPGGQIAAVPGDWIVLSVSGSYHVTRLARRGDV